MAAATAGSAESSEKITNDAQDVKVDSAEASADISDAEADKEAPRVKRGPSSVR